LSSQDKSAELEASDFVLSRHDQQEWDKHLYFKMDTLRRAGLLELRSKVVLDFGCGPAPCGLFLAKENTVVGFDVSQRAVKQAALRARRFGAVNFCGVIGDGDHLPFTYGCFDVCFSSWTLHHFPNVGEIIRSLRGLLRKRGLLVIIEPDEESVLMRLSRLVEEIWKPLVIQSGLDTPNRAIHFSEEYIALAQQENLEVVNQGSYYQAELISIPKDVTGLKKVILSYAIFARHVLFNGGMTLSPRIGGQALFITARARGD
jgi:SAM-dependent methyltransferase